MVVGLMQVELLLLETNSLKDKRSLLLKMRTQIQSKYNVSFSETGSQDIWGRAEIALTTASNDSQFIDRMFTALEKLIEQNPAVRIVQRQMEIL